MIKVRVNETYERDKVMTRESENRTVTMEVSEFSIEAHTMEVSAGH